MKRKIAMLLASMLAAFALLFATSVPAQAFGTFNSTPWACWSSVPYLTVQNPSGNFISVKVINNNDNAVIGTYAVPPATNSSIFAWGFKTVHVQFSGAGNLNWYYQQRCLS